VPRRRIVFALLAGLIVAIGMDAFWLEPDSLALVEHPIVLEGPAALKGLRIAVIADLHAGSPFITEAKIGSVVDKTNAARPDLILLAGDYVRGARGGRRIPIERIAALLRPLSAPLGVYAVLGNHDRWDNGPHIAAVLAQAGIKVLDNASTVLATRRGPLALVGIGDDYSHGADPVRALAGIPPASRALCFTHSPDVFPQLADTCLLTIAGHTHGGQVDLPLLGRLVVPSRYGQRYAAGLVHEGRKYLFVSTGIGTSILAVRFGVAPEISLLDVQ
jgi:predicted MPP superfamily phosphohydrolase